MKNEEFLKECQKNETLIQLLLEVNKALEKLIKLQEERTKLQREYTFEATGLDIEAVLKKAADEKRNPNLRVVS